MFSNDKTRNILINYCKINVMIGKNHNDSQILLNKLEKKRKSKTEMKKSYKTNG